MALVPVCHHALRFVLHQVHEKVVTVKVAFVTDVRRQRLQVLGLAGHNRVRVHEIGVVRKPLSHLSLAIFPSRHGDFPGHAPRHPLGLHHEHGERVSLVLHAHVEQPAAAVPLSFAGPRHPLQAAVQVGRVEQVVAFQAHAFRHEGEVVLVSRAQDDGVELRRGVVRENAIASVHFCQQRKFLEALGPLERHQGVSGGKSDAFCFALVALKSDVVGAPARTDDQNPSVFELVRAAKVVGVQNSPGKSVKPLETGRVRRGIMAGGDHNVVKSFRNNISTFQINRFHIELFALLAVLHLPHAVTRLDGVLGHADGLPVAPQIVEEDGARREGRQRLTEVLLEGVLGKLHALLGRVGAHVSVHAAVLRFPVRVHPRHPRVVPQAARKVLLLVAHQFYARDFFQLGQHVHAARAGPDHADFLHFEETFCVFVLRK